VTPHLVRVRALRPVLATVGTVLLVNKQEAAALIAMGNAERVDEPPPAEKKQDDDKQPPADDQKNDGTYNRRDMVAEDHGRGTTRKTRH